VNAAERILDLGGAEALRAVVDGRAPGIVPAELVAQLASEGSAEYLRGLADGYAQASATHRVESVWSGPHSHTVPVRSTEQALVDLVASATDHLWLTTYSARPHRPVLDALAAARARGVRVRVVVETLAGAGGALGGAEPGAAFLGVSGVELWHWPVAERPQRFARMHAKIAVADRRTLLVSSANFTQSGTVDNIEAGLLVRGGTAPRRATEHLEALVGSGTLARLAVGA
jgi:phosphatidylserine/phosphatidylglycerophosphate/cardiolipin synthase-like enzyme